MDFDAVYSEHFDFVWRSLRRLGVAESSVDDALQDVFLVVHRRGDDFEGRSSVRSWLFGIAMRVAKDHRRSEARRRSAPLEGEQVDDGATPEQEAARRQALAQLDHILGGMEPDRRAIFVMAELEQMTAPEIVQVTGDKLNTVYSKLRLARRDFERAVERAAAQRRTGT